MYRMIFMRALQKKARNLGIKMIIDSSGEELRLAVEEGVYMVKVNLREFSYLTERKMKKESQIEEAALKIIERGKAKVIVISLGAAGAFMVSDDGFRRMNAPVVQIIE